MNAHKLVSIVSAGMIGLSSFSAEGVEKCALVYPVETTAWKTDWGRENVNEKIAAKARKLVEYVLQYPEDGKCAKLTYLNWHEYQSGKRAPITIKRQEGWVDVPLPESDFHVTVKVSNGNEKEKNRDYIEFQVWPNDRRLIENVPTPDFRDKGLRGEVNDFYGEFSWGPGKSINFKDTMYVVPHNYPPLKGKASAREAKAAINAQYEKFLDIGIRYFEGRLKK